MKFHFLEEKTQTPNSDMSALLVSIKGKAVCVGVQGLEGSASPAAPYL